MVRQGGSKGTEMMSGTCIIYVPDITSRTYTKTAKSLETDSFINALRRFPARRGPVRLLRSDQGINLTRTRNELKEALHEMNHDKVESFLLENKYDWFNFEINVPKSSDTYGRRVGTSNWNSL